MERSIDDRARSPVRRLDLGEATISCVGGELWHDERDIGVAVEGVVLEGAGDGGPPPNGAARAIGSLQDAAADRFPTRLQGEFAVAVWDGRERRGLLVRDPYGVRRLYTAHVPGGVLFASELRPLLATGLVDDSLDYAAVELYLDLGFVPAPYTLLRGVRKLPAGHMSVVQEGRHQDARAYYSFPKPAPSSEPVEEAADRAFAALDGAAARHARAANAPGVLLSAGLDSALLLALTVRHARGPVVGLTVGMAGRRGADEIEGARRVAREFDVEHITTRLTPSDASSSLGEMVKLLDEPVADLSLLGLAALARASCGTVDVALSGTLADSLFAADSASRRLEAIGYLNRLPTSMRRAIGEQLGQKPGRLGLFARTLAADTAAERYRVQWALSRLERDRLIRGPLEALDGDATRALLEGYADEVAGHPTEQYSYVEQFLNGDYVCLLADCAMSRTPLEVRFPFADSRVVAVASTIPGSLRSRRGRSKLVLRELARRLLPPSLHDRPKVGFFHKATPGWVRSQLRAGGADLLLDPGARIAEFVDRREVEREIRRTARRGSTGSVFTLLVLESWLTLWLPRVPRRPA